MHFVVYITFYHCGYSKESKTLLGPFSSHVQLMHYSHIGGLNNCIPRKHVFISNH